MVNAKIDVIEEVTRMDDFDDEYVYDIGVESNEPYFFANDLLVHNSVYFSAWPMVKEDVEAGKTDWNKDIATALYEAIADSVNESFPGFMEKACHIPKELGEIIKGGREITAKSALFITKKRYAALVYDDDGVRKDVDGSPGKLKAMGLDLKRSDTPVIVQDFLKDILMDLLVDSSNKDGIIEKIKQFKQTFADLPAWEKGSPKRVNNLTKYSKIYNKTGSCRVGHVLAAINYNKLRKMHGDNYSLEITDGMKVIVCKLRPTPLGMTSIAIPTDESRIPIWFRELPFDDELMEETNVVKKVENLLGVLDWDIKALTDTRSTFDSLFTFT